MHSSDAVALTTATGSRTFAELDDRAARVAAGLAAAGLQPGDRVLAVLPNGQELIELLLCCARSGTVLVPVNWRLSSDEIIAIAEDAGARAIVAATDQPYERGSLSSIPTTSSIGLQSTTWCCRSTRPEPADDPRAS